MKKHIQKLYIVLPPTVNYINILVKFHLVFYKKFLFLCVSHNHIAQAVFFLVSFF